MRTLSWLPATPPYSTECMGSEVVEGGISGPGGERHGADTGRDAASRFDCWSIASLLSAPICA